MARVQCCTEAIAFSLSGSQVYIATNTELLTMSVWGGTTSLLAGGTPGFADGQGTAAMVSGPKSLAVHPVTGMIYFTDSENSRIRTCTPLGLVGTLTGTGTRGNVDGDASTATFNRPWGIVMDQKLVYLYVTCTRSNTLRQVAVLTGFTTTLAGRGDQSSLDGQGTGASFYSPAYVEVGYELSSA